MRMALPTDPWQSSEPQRFSKTMLTPSERNFPGEARVDTLRSSVPLLGVPHASGPTQRPSVTSCARRQLIATPASAQTVRNGELEILPVRREVRIAGRVVEFTALEFDLLLHFASHPGRVFSRTQLLDSVWGYSHEGYEHTVTTHINRLRAKVEQDPMQPRFILTVRGAGYKMRDAPP